MCEKHKLRRAPQSDLLNPGLQQWRQTGAMLSLWPLKRTTLWVHSPEICLKTWTQDNYFKLNHDSYNTGRHLNLSQKEELLSYSPVRKPKLKRKGLCRDPTRNSVEVRLGLLSTVCSDGQQPPKPWLPEQQHANTRLKLR